MISGTATLRRSEVLAVRIIKPRSALIRCDPARNPDPCCSAVPHRGDADDRTTKDVERDHLARSGRREQCLYRPRPVNPLFVVTRRHLVARISWADVWGR